MVRLSKGCLRCRERRVKCDEGRPSCQRCIKRHEICEGYRDEATIIFRYETTKVIEHARASASSVFSSSSSDKSHRRSRSVDTGPMSRSSSAMAFGYQSDLSKDQADGLNYRPTLPWVKKAPEHLQPSVEDQAVDKFMEKYVMYPCNQTSFPGFLEHLPSMFKDVNVEGRYSLRWAVLAAAYADASRESEGDELPIKAMHCYGMALSALGESLSQQSGKAPDDFDLLTIVVLDIFETLFIPSSARKGAHAQGMAQILRLRGSDQVYNPRGWSLFRLAHHRVQKQQLAFNLPAPPESREWLEHLSDEVPFVRLEKDTLNIKETCQRAQELLDLIDSQQLEPPAVAEIAKEMVKLDQAAVSWRQSPEWDFTTLQVYDTPMEWTMHPLTLTIELHADVWHAYEWNYHRTARIIFYQQLLMCLRTAHHAFGLDVTTESTLDELIMRSTETVQMLAEAILSTVPQSLGDIDHLGRAHDSKTGPPRCRAIGCYLLLWPIHVIRAPTSATTAEQRQKADVVFERIREYTGMKSELGDMSII